MQATSAGSIASEFSIPTRPEALILISNEMKKKDPDNKLISEALKQDVTLFAAVIKAINSPLFSLRSKITSIDHALNLLGPQRIFSIVRVTALKTALSNVPGMNRFWDTASEVAQLSATLAKHIKGVDPDDAYTLGMFHDAGIPLMMQRYEDFDDLLFQLYSQGDLCFAEEQQRRYGVSHFDVGFELASSWGISPTVARGIHLQPQFMAAHNGKIPSTDQELILVSTLLAAQVISESFRRYWRIEEHDRTDIDPAIFSHLGISEIDFIDIKDQCLEMLETSDQSR